MPNENPFRLGAYRPIYLWGGAGTVRMNRVKFMDVANDEAVHAEVHEPTGADRVLNALRCNWVHLMYDWGFPPEVEQEDWDDFERAAAVYHERGSKVLAYIQTSNCVHEGSFVGMDWYARDQRGQRIPYFAYTRRHMACLAHPAWRRHLRDLIAGAIERGADGIFFDNIFQGDHPNSMLGAWLGGVGCHCRVCRQAYIQATGTRIPTQVDPRDPAVARYLRWRSGQVTALMAEMAAYARQLQPGTPIAANDYDCLLRDAYLIHGIDLEALAQVQDVTMVENFGLPNWQPTPKPRLANNAITVRTARELVGGAAHLSVLSYDVGIGFDPVYPPRRYQQGIAEAAALGVSMTTKGTEYHDGTQMTLLTDEKYSAVHDAIGAYHAWLQTHADLYGPDDTGAARELVAPVALLFPEEQLWLDWQRLAALYYGAGQTLTAAGIPWRVVRAGEADEPSALQRADRGANATPATRALLCFGEDGPSPALLRALPDDVRIVRVPHLPHWTPGAHSAFARSGALRFAATAATRGLLKLYSEVRPARQLMDAAGLPRIMTQAPFYYLPSDAARQTLLAALPDNLLPRASAREPVLIETWRRGDEWQIHLTNYAAGPQQVEVRLPCALSGVALSPDGTDGETVSGNRFEVRVETYKVVLLHKA